MSGRRVVGVALSFVVLLALVGAGALAYVRQLTLGDIVTGMGTLGAGGVAWGLYVVADGFLLGAGVVIMACACIARFSRDRELEAVARIAMPVAITCFLAAGLCILADQGRPWAAMVNLARVARPESPLFATFTTVAAVGLAGSLVHCVLARRPDLAVYAERRSLWQPFQRLLACGYRGEAAERRRRQQAGLWMSLLMLVLLAVPFAALAIIFTVRPGRPWHVAVCEAIAFTVSSGAGGLGLLVLAAALVGRVAGPTAGLGARGFARLGRGLLLVDALAVLATVAAELSSLTSGEAPAVAYARALLGQPYRTCFWGELGLYFGAGFLLLWATWRSRLTAGVVVAAGALCTVALFIGRYLLLVAWQTHGLSLPYRPGVYAPSWVELAVLAGILALSVLLLLPAVRLIPFAPAAYDEEAVAAQTAGPWRVVATGLWLVVGVGLVVVGLALSLRHGTEPYLDPLVIGSPTLVIAGLLFLVTAGAVYELLPDRRSRTESPAASDDADASARSTQRLPRVVED